MAKSPILNIVNQLGTKQNKNPVLSDYLAYSSQHPVTQQQSKIKLAL